MKGSKNMLRFFEVGEDEGNLIMVMEYCESDLINVQAKLPNRFF
jgi:hypothetical protein